MGRTYPVEGNPKEIVHTGYDCCGVRYNRSRTLDARGEIYHKPAS